MSIAIDPALRAFVDECVRSGKYADESQVVNMALAQMHEREQLLREIDAGLADFERGDFVEYGPNDRQRFVDDIRVLSQKMPREGSEP